MFGMKGKSWFDPEYVQRKANQGCFKSLNHAAAAIRITARRSIRRNRKESPVGTPPHTRRGQLKRGLLYNVDRAKLTAVIGPAYTFVGKSGSAHELGGEYFGRKYPARPFMGPALQANLHRVAQMWRDSVK